MKTNSTNSNTPTNGTETGLNTQQRRFRESLLQGNQGLGPISSQVIEELNDQGCGQESHGIGTGEASESEPLIPHVAAIPAESAPNSEVPMSPQICRSTGLRGDGLAVSGSSTTRGLASDAKGVQKGEREALEEGRKSNDREMSSPALTAESGGGLASPPPERSDCPESGVSMVSPSAEYDGGVETGANTVSKVWTGSSGSHRDSPNSVPLRLIALFSNHELFTTADGRGSYIIVPRADGRDVYEINGEIFREVLQESYFKECNQVPTKHAINDTVRTFEAIAKQSEDCRQVFTRTAEHNGKIYVDLCDAQRRVVEISSTGFQVVADAPVLFRRDRSMLPLPVPEAEHDGIGELRRFLNIETDENFVLLVAFLINCFNPTGPYLHLVVCGEPGTAKTTLLQIVKDIVDPADPSMHGEPNNTESVLIAARHSHLLCYDNLSRITQQTSDVLCRLSAGAAQMRRKLYSDGDPYVLKSRNPVAMNGIRDVATKGDLAERCLLLELTPIGRTERRDETVLLRDFEEARPRILGALFDGISAMLRNRKGLRLKGGPRMFDSAIAVTAAEEGVGFPKGAYLTAIQENQVASHTAALIAHPIGRVMWRHFVENGNTPFEGTSTAFLKEIERSATEAERRARYWPDSPETVANALKELAPSLLAAGFEVEKFRTARSRLIRIEYEYQIDSSQNPSGLRRIDGEALRTGLYDRAFFARCREKENEHFHANEC